LTGIAKFDCLLRIHFFMDKFNTCVLVATGALSNISSMTLSLTKNG